jgi:hypothetical protein
VSDHLGVHCRVALGGGARRGPDQRATGRPR